MCEIEGTREYEESQSSPWIEHRHSIMLKKQSEKDNGGFSEIAIDSAKQPIARTGSFRSSAIHS